MSELREKYGKEIDEVLAKYPPEQKRSALLPLLTMAQRENGRISDATVDEIAEILGITPHRCDFNSQFLHTLSSG